MNRSTIAFLLAAALSFGIIVYGFLFINTHAGKTALTEETISGSNEAASGLAVGFAVASDEDLHWNINYDYTTSETDSTFERRIIEVAEERSLYDDLRFTGWSTIPYSTRLNYAPLEDVQNAEIHKFYDDIQKKVMDTGITESGEIRVKDYLDYYPISFRFQFGSKVYNSDDILTGLKIYDQRGKLIPENVTAYNSIVDMYVCLSNLFRIPVIDNEYQEYRVSKLDIYDNKTSLGYETEIARSVDNRKDYYEFDPIIALQEENIMDGIKWEHPDQSEGLEYEAGEAEDETETKTAADYGLKNRMLFIVNNRTAKGEPIDVSEIVEGFGIYELPIDTVPSATVRHGHRSEGLRNPIPLMDQLSMVYPLNSDAEYIDISISKDHRHLAIFYISDGYSYVEIIDADTWETCGTVKLFETAEVISYSWGEDGSLAITNNENALTVIAGNDNGTYYSIYSGHAEKNLIEALFDIGENQKANYYGQHYCYNDSGLAVAVNDGKAALIQSILIGDDSFSIRGPVLECAVVDSSGVLYWGKLKSNLTDIDYGIKATELKNQDNYNDENVMQLLIKPSGDSKTVEWR